MKQRWLPSTFSWLIIILTLLPVVVVLVQSVEISGTTTSGFQQLASPIVDPNAIDKDVTPPTVSLTSPGAGASLSGTVTISADASDDVSVASVSFYQNGNLITTDTSAPYGVNWDTSAVSNGSYSLTARAVDTGSNQTTSSAVSVSVSNQSNPPPVNPNPPAGNSSTDPNHLADGARVLFVDKNNASCSDSGSRTAALNPSTPWCSPAGMNENSGRKFQPGDTVYVKSGDYSIAPLTLYSAGSSGQPINWKPYPGDSVTIRGNGQSTALVSFQAGANYWLVDGLNFTDSSASLLFDVNQSSGLTVRNARFGPGRSGSSLIRLSGGHSGALFENNDIFCTSGSSGPAGGDGLIWDNVQSSVVRNNRFGNCGHVSLNLRNSGNNIIEKNIIENGLHTSAAIINIPGNPGTASGNIFRQNLVRNFNSNPSEPGLPGIGLEILYASGNSVYNNIFASGANDSTGLSIAANPNIGQSNNNKIYNNTFYQTGGRGIEMGNFGGSGSSNGVSGNKIYNNIIVNTSNNSTRNAPISLTFPNFEENSGYSNEIKNNLLIAGDNVVVKSRGANAALRFSYTSANLNTQSFASSNLNSDPQFASTGASFPLSVSSPAGNAGLCQGEVNGDYNGNSRPSSGCDIGAFESVAGAVAPLVAAVCGNNQVETGEQCDGSGLAGASCASFGFTGGVLRCSAQCRYETSQCLGTPTIATSTTPVASSTLPVAVQLCDNGVINPGEQCDGANLNGRSCSALGFAGGGALKCLNRFAIKPCSFDLRQCQTLATNQSPSTKPATTPVSPNPKPVVKPASGCQEHWLCQESWSECVGGRQSRLCTDLRKCGTVDNKPKTEQSCVVSGVKNVNATSTGGLLNITDAQAKTLSILIPTFFATLAILVTILVRIWL